MLAVDPGGLVWQREVGAAASKKRRPFENHFCHLAGQKPYSSMKLTVMVVTMGVGTPSTVAGSYFHV